MLVWPTSDVMRKTLKHPHRQVGFREEGPIDWPDDAFTHRRIMDGDVTDEAPVVHEAVTATPTPPVMELPTVDDLVEPISMQADDPAAPRKSKSKPK